MSTPNESKALENLEARISRLEDIEAIKQLIARYAEASDKQNDPDLMVPLFTKDGALDIGSDYGRYQGHEVLRAFFLTAPKIISWSLHYNIPSIIEVSDDGKSATASWYLWELANMPDPVKDEEVPVWIGGTYTSDLVKEEDGEWRWTEVRLKMELMSPYEHGWVKKPWHDLGRPSDSIEE